MKGQARILQQGIQTTPIQRHRIKAQKRVGGKQDEQQKADSDHRLHRQGASTQLRRNIAPCQRHCQPKQAKNGDPQQQRPFVIAPNTTDFIEHRLIGMRIFVNVRHRKIRSNIGIGQAAKGQRHQ
jgi:hypothetical protein